MNDALDAHAGTMWQTLGDYEHETDRTGYTGWIRCVGGRTVDGRWPETNQRTGEVRDHRIAFPDGRTEMRADELPVHWLGYIDNNAANIGMEAFEGSPGFVSENQVVYVAPRDGHTATLERKPGDRPSFEFRLPRGQEFGGCSTFWVVFSNFYR